MVLGLEKKKILNFCKALQKYTVICCLFVTISSRSLHLMYSLSYKNAYWNGKCNIELKNQNKTKQHKQQNILCYIIHTLREFSGRQMRSSIYDKAKLKSKDQGRVEIKAKSLSSCTDSSADSGRTSLILCLSTATCLEWLTLISSSCYHFKNSNKWDVILLQLRKLLFVSLCNSVNLIMQ